MRMKMAIRRERLSDEMRTNYATVLFVVIPMNIAFKT